MFKYIDINLIIMNFFNFPKELINIILDYDGRLKYNKGKYINIIHKYDFRYDIISDVIHKKKEILKNIVLEGNSFYFGFSFNQYPELNLCYDFNFSFGKEMFEICYVNFKDFKQIRTIIN